LQGEVFFYYGLVNFYQNHRRYVRSRDDQQLLGKSGRASSDCQPFQRASNGSDVDVCPCGAIANSRFNGQWRTANDARVDVVCCAQTR
jgi:hypothetical protein